MKQNYIIASLLIVVLIGFSIFNFQPTGHFSKNTNEKTGAVYIKSTPIESEVFIDGEFKGTTPIVMNYIKYGTHKITVEKEGYTTQERTFTMSQNKRPFDMEFILFAKK